MQKKIVLQRNQKTTTMNRVCLHNIVVCNGATLTIQSQLTFHYGAGITVEPGGKLILDGGSVLFGDIQLQNGSQLCIINGGECRLPSTSSFSAPIGVKVDIFEGAIY